MAHNLVPPGDTHAHVTASEGKVYVAFQPLGGGFRASYTVHATTGLVVNNHDPALGRADITAVCDYLHAAGQDPVVALVTDHSRHLPATPGKESS